MQDSSSFGDPAGLAEAYREAAKVESHLGRTEQADALFVRAVDNARASGSPPDRSRRPRLAPRDGLLGLPAGESRGYPRDDCAADRWRDGHGEGVRARRAGTLPRDAGRSRGGRADTEAGRALIREFGAGFYVAGSGQEQAQLELESGEPAAAETAAREAFETYRALSGSEPAGAATLLARALIEQGRIDEGDRSVRIAETAQEDDISAQSEWRCLRARILVRRGDPAEAEALARGRRARSEHGLPRVPRPGALGARREPWPTGPPRLRSTSRRRSTSTSARRASSASSALAPGYAS